jgi:preprotein translocase SecE subunit
MATDRPRRGDNDADIGDDRVRDDDFEPDFGEAEPPDPLEQAEPTVGRPERTRRRSRAERAERAQASAAAGRAGNVTPEVANGEGAAPDEGHGHEVAHPVSRKGVFGRATDFLRASYAELRRVQWPDRRQVGQGTAVTLGFVVVAGAYLGLLDAIWNPIIQAIL